MASEAEKSSTAMSDKTKRLTQEQIVSGYNQLRQEQKSLVSKVTDLEQDLNEHTLVVAALEKVDGNRKCFRMIGGVLVERTVQEVLPAVGNNKEQLAKLVRNLNQQIDNKSKELSQYKEKHNLQVRGEPIIDYSKGQQSGDSSSTSVLVETRS